MCLRAQRKGLARSGARGPSKMGVGKSGSYVRRGSPAGISLTQLGCGRTCHAGGQTFTSGAGRVGQGPAGAPEFGSGGTMKRSPAWHPKRGIGDSGTGLPRESHGSAPRSGGEAQPHEREARPPKSALGAQALTDTRLRFPIAAKDGLAIVKSPPTDKVSLAAVARALKPKGRGGPATWCDFKYAVPRI